MASSSSSSSPSSFSSSSPSSSSRKRLWSPEEDSTLIKCVGKYGPGKWNKLARISELGTLPLKHFAQNKTNRKDMGNGKKVRSFNFALCAESTIWDPDTFAGVAQSLGAGAILVNPWNITEVAASIGQALDMLPEEREKRHKHNFAHVTTRTAQEWPEIELNDTVVEAQLRTKQVPPQFPVSDAIERYLQSNNRLLILGFNTTLT